MSVDEPLQDDSGPVIQHRRQTEDMEMDITPMIDITFLLLIFFLVASIPDPQTAVDLPSAVSGNAINASEAVIITIGKGPGGDGEVFLSDGRIGDPVTDDPQGQREALSQYLQAGVDDGKTKLLIKGEGDVKNSVAIRVSSAASEANLPVHWAVMEADE